MARAQVKLVIKSVDKLTAEEYKQCYSLNLRRLGCMREDLVKAKRDLKRFPPGEDRVFLLKSPDTNELIAWAFLCKRWAGNYFGEFYVRKLYRRQGYGTMLFNTMKKHKTKFRTQSHDWASSQFFNKNKIRKG